MCQIILSYNLSLPERQCLAYPANTSDLKLLEWVKPSTNPVIENPPDEGSADFFRDPSTAWRDGERYFIAIGAAFAGSGAALVYCSTDQMNSWSYVGVLNNGTFPGMQRSMCNIDIPRGLLGMSRFLCYAARP